MKISDVAFSILRCQYQLARFPLQLIEDRVVTRLATEAPARLFYEGALGKLDAALGSALGDPRLSEGGSALIERSDTLARLAAPEAKATARQEEAGAEADA